MTFSNKILDYFNTEIADEGRPSSRDDIMWSGALRGVCGVRNRKDDTVWYVIFSDDEVVGAMTRSDWNDLATNQF